MKKLTFALSAAVALVASGSAMAQTNPDTITVDGVIPSVCTLDIVQGPAIDLHVNSWQHVADVEGACNNGSNNVTVSYTHDAYSLGGFAAFRHVADNSELIGFRAQVTPPGGTSPANIPIGLTFPLSQGNGVAHQLNFEPYGSLANLAGDYETVMTIEVLP